MSDINCIDPEFSRNLNINEILRDMENKTKEISLNEDGICVGRTRRNFGIKTSNKARSRINDWAPENNIEIIPLDEYDGLACKDDAGSRLQSETGHVCSDDIDGNFRKLNKRRKFSFEDDEFKYLDQLWSVLDNCDLTKKVTKGDVIEWYKIVVECRDSIGTYDQSSDDGFVKLFKKCFDNGLFRGGVNSEVIKKFLCKN
jgi:hypothetical protein